MNQAINPYITDLNNIGQGFWDYAAGIFIQSGVLIILLLVIDFLLRKRVRAVFRYCLWMLLFVKLVLPASFTLPTGIGYWLGDYFTSEVSIAKFVPQTEEAIPIAINIPQGHIPLETPMMNETAATEIELEPICWQGLVFLSWLVGMLVLLALLVQRIRFVKRLIAQSKPANKRLHEMLDECRSQIGIRQNIELKLSGNTLSPAVCGLFKPIILMPATLPEKLSREKLKAVLIHELAHIKRADVWVNLLQTMLQIVYFYNPLIWIANAMVRRAREQAVDEMVLVTLKPETKSYSNTLIDVAEMAFSKPNFSLRLIGVVESKKALERRIKHMLNRPVPKSSKLGFFGGVAIVVIGAIILPMGCNPAKQTASEVPVKDGRIADKIIVPGLRVGEYTFDMNKDDVLKSLGEPKFVFYGKQRYSLDNLPRTYYMSFDDVSFRIHDDSVKEITVLSPLYKFANGLRVGDSEQKIKQAFGDNVQLKETEGKDYLSYEDKGLVFEIHKKNRTVMEINVLLVESFLTYESKPVGSDEFRSQKEIIRSSVGRPGGSCSLSGKVVSAETGEPVGHARVYMFYLGTHAPIFINVASDGSFVFKDIPTGPFSLRTTNTAGYQDADYNPEGKLGRLPQFSLEDGEQRSGVILEAAPAFRISGKVLDENGNLPANIDGFLVKAWAKKKDNNGYETAGRHVPVNRADGSWSIDGLDGRAVYVMAINWRAARQGNAYPPIYYPGTFSRNEAKLITFDKERDVKNIDFRLQKGGGIVLDGIVTDETGKPVPEAFVVVHRRDMLFDFATAYTDEKGHYEIQGLGEGEFLVHADAVHRGLVRTRVPIDIDGASQKTQLDLKLKHGVTISGKFVDVDGNEWQIAQSHGSANIKDRQGPSSSFSLTDFRNKYRPKNASRGSGGEFYSGEGDYEGGSMIFPTKSTFILQGLIPGQTLITFMPKKEGQKVLKILYNGQNIMNSGLKTEPGQELKGVTIVIKTDSKKLNIPSTSTINKQGHIVDKIDYPFVKDSQVIGTWKSVDFVKEIGQFKVNEKQWKGRGGKLFLRDLVFEENGRVTCKNDKVPNGYSRTWTKGLVLDAREKTASKYHIKEIESSEYMFYEWKSGDYTFRHRKPSYYVLKKISSKTS